jgi:hypothetical protein
MGKLGYMELSTIKCLPQLIIIHISYPYLGINLMSIALLDWA